MKEDINDYGRFQTLYSEDERRMEAEKPTNFERRSASDTRPNAFVVSDNRGSLMFKQQQ